MQTIGNPRSWLPWNPCAHPFTSVSKVRPTVARERTCRTGWMTSMKKKQQKPSIVQPPHVFLCNLHHRPVEIPQQAPSHRNKYNNMVKSATNRFYSQVEKQCRGCHV
jgi:hypothetical protein